MLVVILVVSTLDSTDETSAEDNVDSVLHVLTYTWNWYVQENLVTSRPDFGHLWYLSVDMQAFVIMAVFLYVLRRRPVGLLWALGGFLLLLTWWRFHVTDTEYVFQVLVRTTARMDPFVVGVMLGAALPLVRRLRPPPAALRALATATFVALLPLMWFCSRDDRFLGWGVTLLELDLALLFGAIALLGTAPGPVHLVATRPLAFLGRHSLLIYIWHYPVFVFVQRHTDDWSWPLRTAVGLGATAVIAVVSHRLVERRATELLRHPVWTRLEEGLVPAARDEVEKLVTRGRSRSGPRSRS
jgi:peptidoglycan/LPS O-acetylase OafA/YrhL